MINWFATAHGKYCRRVVWLKNKVANVVNFIENTLWTLVD
jgi:hypothetical protein